jgi:hypothetical protein
MVTAKLFLANGDKIRGLAAVPGGVGTFEDVPKAGDYISLDELADGRTFKVEAAGFLINEDAVRLIVSQINDNGPDVNLLQVGVTPNPVPLNKAVTITVNANDVSTGSSVAGQVKIDGKVTANTNAPFSHTFKSKRRRISDDPPEWEITYPIGIIVAPGYPDAPIDFDFLDV